MVFRLPLQLYKAQMASHLQVSGLAASCSAPCVLTLI